MSDPIDLTSIATHGVGGVGSGTLGAWLMHVFKSRKEEEREERRVAQEQSTAIALANLSQKIEHLIVASEKNDSLREDVALLKSSTKAFHERLDRLDGPVTRRKK